MSVKIFKLSLPVIVAGLVPVAAFATEEEQYQPTLEPVVEAPATPDSTTDSTTTTTTTTPTTMPVAEPLPAKTVVAADDDDDDGLIGNALVTPAGVYGFVGGGATNFTQDSHDAATATGGYWDARVGVGTRSILGGEVAYVGSARDINALGAGSEAFLMSNGVEGVARLNLPMTPDIGADDGKFLIEPYTFGGIGWNRFNVVSDASLTADFTNEDDVLTVPMGLGLAFGFSGVTLDTRATYRAAVGSDLFGSETSAFGDDALNSWAAGAALGFEF